jgi:hypothetical protein|nr:MAG TPA: hypothetical protein [Caudoviricetes sp.]
MSYNPKINYSFWLQNCLTQKEISESRLASIYFICDMYQPKLHLVCELLTYLKCLDSSGMSLGIRCSILNTILELQDKIDFCQNILKEYFPIDSDL